MRLEAFRYGEDGNRDQCLADSQRGYYMKKFKTLVNTEYMKASKRGAATILMLLGIAGCAVHPTKSEFTSCDLKSDHLNPTEPGNAELESLFLDANKSIVKICSEGDYQDFKNFDALALSGGGPDGAFGSGFLSQLIESHKMAARGQDDLPHPCLITGISTGAIMAPYVYLATSLNTSIRDKYVHKLHDLYLDFDDKNLLKERSKFSLLSNNSFYDVSGIVKAIHGHLTPEMIEDIHKEYLDTHRTILIGATEYYSGEFEVFDLTKLISNAVEKNSKSDLICAAETVRASAAIPVAFEPVPINDAGKYKLFLDGGVRHLVFVNGNLFKKLSDGKKPRLFGVINNTGVYARFDDKKTNKMLKKLEVSILDVADRSATLAGDQLSLDSAFLTDQSSANFGAINKWVDAKYAASDDWKCPDKLPEGKIFDPKYQECLINSGAKKALSTNPWDLIPKIIPTRNSPAE